MKLIKTAVSILLCILCLSACSGDEINNSADDSNINSAISSENSQSDENTSTSSISDEDSVEDRKAKLAEYFNHEKYNKSMITLLSKEASSIWQENAGDSNFDTYTYYITDDGKELFLKSFNDYIFYGKYSLYCDMYDFGGYDPGDKFVIYYEGDIPSDGDMMKMNIITMAPEYQLISSKAQGAEEGEKYIEESLLSLNRYLYEYSDVEYNTMSAEEAIKIVLNRKNYIFDDFEKGYLHQGGFYYTNGDIYVTAIIDFVGYTPYITAKEEPNSVFVDYKIYGFSEEPNENSEYIFIDGCYNSTTE